MRRQRWEKPRSVPLARRKRIRFETDDEEEDDTVVIGAVTERKLSETSAGNT
jgi:hypothetical protein